jgi:hypothetical protein
MCKQNLDLCVRELGLNYFQSCSLQKPKSFAKLVGNLRDFQPNVWEDLSFYLCYSIIRTAFSFHFMCLLLLTNRPLFWPNKTHVVQQSLEIHGLEEHGPWRYTVFNWIPKHLRYTVSGQKPWRCTDFFRDTRYLNKSLEDARFSFDVLYSKRVITQPYI